MESQNTCLLCDPLQLAQTLTQYVLPLFVSSFYAPLDCVFPACTTR